jgi:uncharacterized protein (TIGR02145 family)
LNYQSGLTFNQQAGQANGVSYTNSDNGVPAIGSFWCPAVSGATLSAKKNTCNVYGALYTWETAMSEDGLGTWNESSVLGRYHDVSTMPAASQNDLKVQGICPAGWHLPSDYEWAMLFNGVDPTCGSYTAATDNKPLGSDNQSAGPGAQMRSAATYLGADPGNGSWAYTAFPAFNTTGFTVLPAGTRDSQSKIFSMRGGSTRLVTSTPVNETSQWIWYFGQTMWQGLRQSMPRANGFSVRCVAN